MDTLGRAFVRVARQRRSALCMADSTGRELTFGRALVASLLLARIVHKRTAGEPLARLLLPASVGGSLANRATSISGSVPVNLNFPAGRGAIATAIERTGIRTILTSRVFLSKAGLDEMAGMVFLEDLLAEPSGVEKAAIAVATAVLPAAALNRLFVHEQDADSLATVIFSSGSTGVPKGVKLSHRNVRANIDAAMKVFRLGDRDVMLGVLPFFHSFGFTVTLWLPLICGFATVYHPNPMDAKTIGELAEKYHGTVLISTPTFCLSYVRKVEPEQFGHLRYAIVGAERLREPIAAAFKEKFGIDLIEGYGCTEMAPVVAANLNPSRNGSVGRPLPGIAAKVVDPETGEPSPPGREGLLLLKGPNQMLGYLGEDARTREADRKSTRR